MACTKWDIDKVQQFDYYRDGLSPQTFIFSESDVDLNHCDYEEPMVPSPQEPVVPAPRSPSPAPPSSPQEPVVPAPRSLSPAPPSSPQEPVVPAPRSPSPAPPPSPQEPVVPAPRSSSPAPPPLPQEPVVPAPRSLSPALLPSPHEGLLAHGSDEGNSTDTTEGYKVPQLNNLCDEVEPKRWKKRNKKKLVVKVKQVGLKKKKCRVC